MIKNRNENGRIKRLYDDDYMKNLCIEYSEKRNAKEISEREGIPKVTLYHYIRKFKLNKPRRLYNLNEDYFKNINSQNKAYILGFIMADGCVCKSTINKKEPDRLIIQISYKDRHILEFIQKELNSNYKIKDFVPTATFSNNMMSSLTINSTKLCKDLVALGVIPNKTGKESFPNIKENLKRHFIRGFLDGDGWITKSNNVTTIGFVSNKEMLMQIRKVIDFNLDIHGVATIHEDSRDDKKNKNIYYLNYSHRKDINQLKKYLYNKANFYLERKASKLT